MIKNIKWLALVSLTIVACSGTEDVATTVAEVPAAAGSANFSTYVALGDSFAAGFSDGALFMEGQNNSYPNLLAKQFATAGGGAFKTPLTADNVGGLLLAGTPIQGPRLFFNGKAPATLTGQPTTDITKKVTGPFNNMGVPGAKVYHLLAPNYGNIVGVASGLANPYFARFASTASTTVLADALAQNPTFFSLWIGGNDVLGYAISGGTGKNQSGNLDPSTYGSNDITDPMVFAGAYSGLITGLTSKGAKGVVANIPDITSLPFFTTVPTDPIPGLPAASAAQLNQLFGGINAALASFGQPARFKTLVADDGNDKTIEKNSLLIVDENLIDISAQITAGFTPSLGAQTAAFLGSIYGKARHANNTATTKDLILLTASSSIGTTQTGVPASFSTIGVSYPMQDNTTLIPSEVAEIRTAATAYNVTIKALADAKGLAFVDAKEITDNLSKSGIVSNGFTFSSAFIFGGVFSLDGIHPGARGYALIANKFSEAINAKYSSTLKGLDLGSFPTLYPAKLP